MTIYKIPKLGIKKIKNKYWVTKLPPYYANDEGPFTTCGPYDTIAEAKDERYGMQRTFDKIGDGTGYESKKKQQPKATTFKQIIQKEKPKAIEPITSDDGTGFW